MYSIWNWTSDPILFTFFYYLYSVYFVDHTYFLFTMLIMTDNCADKSIITSTIFEVSAREGTHTNNNNNYYFYWKKLCFTIGEMIKYRCLGNKLANNLVTFESGPRGIMADQFVVVEVFLKLCNSWVTICRPSTHAALWCAVYMLYNVYHV